MKTEENYETPIKKNKYLRDNNITGLLPYWSLNPPRIGAKRNWSEAYENISQPLYFAASLIVPFISSDINAGITGIIIPRPVISIKIVMKINKRLWSFFFICKTAI